MTPAVTGQRQVASSAGRAATPFKDERMNRAWGLAAGVGRRHFLALSAALGVAGVVGCKSSQKALKPMQSRSQIGEDPSDPDSVVTIGTKTTVSNAESLVVNGVGLVYQLPGTGSSPPPDGWRTMLEDSLKKLKRDQSLNLKALLDGPGRTTSLVFVSALVPPGSRKGDPIDVQVTLPDGSKTTSLQGGVLFPVDLYTSDSSNNVRSQVLKGTPGEAGGRLLMGNVWARAQGPLVAGSFVQEGGKTTGGEDGSGRPSYRAGVIASGGRVLANRSYYLLLNTGDQNARISAGIAERLNTTFHTTSDPNLKVAVAKDKELIVLNVPTAYRHNHYRFLLVARQVPYYPLAAGNVYRQRLEEELLDPGTAITAAVKLEALGGDCPRSLRLGLESPSPWVRFAAAEALAYLGQSDSASELARLAEDHPALRAQCLRALASIDDGSSTDRLVEMLASSDPDLRQGAFASLRVADEHHPALGGTLMSHSYWLHRLAPSAAPAVHISTSGRTEILLFGDARLRGPLPPMALGEDFTVSWKEGQPTVRVARVVKGKEQAEVKEARCAPNLAAILGAMATLGGGYVEAVELIRKADHAEALAAKVVMDAFPRELSVQQLAGFAKVDPTLAKANVEVARVGTTRPAVDDNGYELPVIQDPHITPAGAPLTRPPLNRDPGRLFGPKRTPDAPVVDPAVVTSGGQ